MKSLRSTGSAVARCASRRSSSEPPKWNGSVSTDSAVAPPRSYARTTSATGAPSRMTPADGERRLCSAGIGTPGRGRRAAAGPGQRLGERPEALAVDPLGHARLELGQRHPLAAPVQLVACVLDYALQDA